MSRPAFDKLLAQCQKPGPPAIVEAAVLSAEEAEHLVAALAEEEIEARHLDGTRLTGKADLLRELAKAFAFPSHFGHNWDALIDCLSDLSWLPAKGYVIVLTSADAFKAADSRAHETLLEVAEDVSERWREYDAAVVFKLLRGAKG
jgi:RNAse (barnase) inhibitor barstar